MADFREMTGCPECVSRPWTGRRPRHVISPGGARPATYAVARGQLRHDRFDANGPPHRRDAGIVLLFGKAQRSLIARSKEDGQAAYCSLVWA
jgi:hypothetical protein